MDQGPLVIGKKTVISKEKRKDLKITLPLLYIGKHRPKKRSRTKTLIEFNKEYNNQITQRRATSHYTITYLYVI